MLKKIFGKKDSDTKKDKPHPIKPIQKNSIKKPIAMQQRTGR